MTYSPNYDEFFCDVCQGSIRKLKPGCGWLEIIIDVSPIDEDGIIEHICDACHDYLMKNMEINGEPWYWDHEHTIF